MTGEKRKINSEGPEGYTNAGPVPKRVYSTADNPGYDSSDKTILDILIEDCWRVLFGYVSVVDIVRSRRVSRRWCDLVDGYLKGVRLCIQSRSSAVLKPDRVVKGRVLDVHPKYYNTVIERYGRSIVATDCLDESSLCLLLKHCLGLEELRVHKPGLKYDLETRALQFYKLRRVCLMYIFHFDDDHIRKFLKCHKLEELKIDHNHVMKGQCLTHLTQNLKTLQLDSCRALCIKPLLHSIKSLTELTKLELNCASKSILQNVYKLIEKTPKLEHLGLDWYKITDVGGLVEAICGLKRLKHLSLRFNRSVKDEWLEAIGTSCKELRTVAIGGCKYVTAVGVLTLCRVAGKTLTALSVTHNGDLTEYDMIRCVYYCPKLELLDLQCCRGVSLTLPSACARQARVVPRARPLRLRLQGTAAELCKTKETYENLIMDFSSSEWDCHNY